MNPLKQWRSWVLALLLVGPVLVYMTFGMIWFYNQGWLILSLATSLWILSGIAFSVLAARWTKSSHPMMPPLDWESPQTFSPLDRSAWLLVQNAADEGESLPYEKLLDVDCYINSGRDLFHRLADHYHPLVSNPIDDVPIVELMTALELAAEDLAKLCRQLPGGDLITLSHWRKAVQVAGYISKANDLYSYLLPFLSPVGGLARWGSREWIVKPAWKSMQQNMLRWFYHAYLNRLGTHLIELQSGRLAIGADQYRRLTRKKRIVSSPQDEEPPVLRIVVAGCSSTVKSQLVLRLREACGADLTLLKAKLSGLSIDPNLLESLQAANWIVAPDYPSWTDSEGRRDRARRQVAVESAVQADLMIHVIDGRQSSDDSDVAFAQAFDRWFIEHPENEIPPAVVALSAVDDTCFGDDWYPPYDWSAGKRAREVAVRARIDLLRTKLPPPFSDFVAVGLSDQNSYGVVEHLLPKLAIHLPRAERTALIRRLHRIGGRSKVGRLLKQIGEQGRSLWSDLKRHQKTGSKYPGN